MPDLTALLSDASALLQDQDALVRLLLDAPLESLSVMQVNSGDEGAGDTAVALLEKPTILTTADIFTLLWVKDFFYWNEWTWDTSPKAQKTWEDILDGGYLVSEFNSYLTVSSFANAARAGKSDVVDLIDQVEFDCFKVGRRRYPKLSFRSQNGLAKLSDLRRKLENARFLSACHIQVEWNEKSVFFETESDFGLISWGTSA